MSLLKAFFMAFSMFCALPSPYQVWEDRLRPLMTAMVGLVGVWIGLLWAGVAFVCHYFALPTLLSAVIVTVTPWMLSGYLHLDGFMDCADAILSRRDLEGRRRIVKDPLCGPFAVISFVCLAMVSVSAVASCDLSQYWVLVWIATVPRSLSAIAVLHLKATSHSQYAQQTVSKAVSILSVAIFVVAIVTAGLFAPLALYCALATAIGWCVGCWRGHRCLAGMSGDISGYAITVGEACGLVAWALVSGGVL